MNRDRNFHRPAPKPAAAPAPQPAPKQQRNPYPVGRDVAISLRVHGLILSGHLEAAEPGVLILSDARETRRLPEGGMSDAVHVGRCVVERSTIAYISELVR